MTTKPIAVWTVWAICNPKGQPIRYTFAEDIDGAISRWLHIAKDRVFNMWDLWEAATKRGYQCKRFILSEAEGHEQRL